MTPLRFALQALVVAALIVGLTGSCSSGDDKRIRVVLITLDTLRLDSLPVASEGHMPLTAEFAQRGLRFENFFAATSTTQPTHATLFTGRHPWQTGVPRNGTILSEEHVTLAERLKERGFATSAVVASFPLHSKFGFAQGFDRYLDDFTELMNIDRWEGKAVDRRRFYSLGEDVADRAISEIDMASAERQFYWFHFYDAHDPYGDTGSETVDFVELKSLAAAKDPRLGRYIKRARDLYDRDVESMDRALGRILRRLKRDADEYETHIVLTSDHGESFGEGGSLGHGRRLTREQVQVPLVIVSPRLEPALRSDVAGSIDIAATLLALAGVHSGEFGGRSLVEEEDGPPTVGMRRTYAKPYADTRTDGKVVQIAESWFYAVRDGVLYAGNETTVVEEDQADAPAPTAIAKELRTLFGAFQRSLRGVGLDEAMDADDIEALRHLGYVR